jgi:Spy/CpxP family protein refolding chaperone
MGRKMLRVVVAATLAGFAAIAFAQAPERGSIPPGSAADGSRPSDGAITGGSILPGERGGVPEGKSATDRRQRCNELPDSLRAECLLKEQSSSGSSGAPDPKATRMPGDPPPQNPPQLSR